MATEKTKKTTIKKTVSKKSSEKKASVNLNRFAVVDVNGNQLKVYEGHAYTVNKLEGKKGEDIRSEKVLLIADGNNVKVGKPYVDKATVTFEIESQKKDEKLDIFKYKSKSRYRRSYGQRQLITRIRVKEIVG